MPSDFWNCLAISDRIGQRVIIRIERLRSEIISREFGAKKTVIRGERELDLAQPRQRQVAQTAAHGIADDQRADEHGAAHRRAQQRAQIRAGVKAQAAKDEGPGGHRGRE